jgi:hypothetical protein
MAHIIQGPWTTSPARVDQRLEVLPEPKTEMVLLMREALRLDTTEGMTKCADTNLNQMREKYTGPPMTLGNMRRNGVHRLIVYCLGRRCHRDTVLDVSEFPDDVPVPSFGPRMRCEVCGHVGADVRPNWSERPL